jgi:two-component system, sensor histidine kinase YesM
MKRFTIQKRIFLYIVLLVSFLLSSIIIANYTIFFEFLKKNEMESAISAAQKTKQNIEIILKLAYDMSSSIGDKSEVLGELKRGDLSNKTEVNQINKMLEQHIDLQEYFDGVYIIGENGTFISSDPKSDLKSILKRCQLPEDIHNKIESLFSNSNRKGYYLMSSDENVISFISSIQDNFTGQYIGIVIVDINHTYLREAFSAASFENVEKVMIVNRRGDILFSFPFNVYLGEVIEQNPELLDLQTTQVNSKVFNKDSIIVSDTINYSDWKLIRIINTDKIFRSVNMLGKISLYIFLFFILVSLIASLLLSVSFTKPVVELNNKIKRVEKGDLSVTISTERKDELGELSASFDNMVVQLKNLIKEKVDQQKKKSDMEFQVLQAQINPHFLYNTLNSIKWLAVIQNIENISEMTSAIINLLKYNISSKNILVTLGEEIESIKNYASIQKYRYGSNFNIEYEIDDNTTNLKILKFILQPLVENSIFHGFKNYKYGGEIKIRSQIINENLLIEVIDNGCGIDKEKSESHDDETGKMHSGIGLNNVNERICIYFGSKFGITVKSEEGNGTCVMLTLPIIKKEFHNRFSNLD